MTDISEEELRRHMLFTCTHIHTTRTDDCFTCRLIRAYREKCVEVDRLKTTLEATRRLIRGQATRKKAHDGD